MKTKYIYSNNEITATKVDGQDLWIAFRGSAGVCKLYRVDVFDPDSVTFEIDITADEITNIEINSSYICLSLDSTYLGAIISKGDYSVTYINKTGGITEKTVDLVISTYLYFLTPGIDSGVFTNIIKVTISDPTVQDIMELNASGEEINNATNIDIDSEGKLWVVSENDPKILTKVDFGNTYESYTLS